MSFCSAAEIFIQTGTDIFIMKRVLCRKLKVVYCNIDKLENPPQNLLRHKLFFMRRMKNYVEIKKVKILLMPD